MAMEKNISNVYKCWAYIETSFKQTKKWIQRLLYTNMKARQTITHNMLQSQMNIWSLGFCIPDTTYETKRNDRHLQWAIHDC